MLSIKERNSPPFPRLSATSRHQASISARQNHAGQSLLNRFPLFPRRGKSACFPYRLIGSNNDNRIGPIWRQRGFALFHESVNLHFHYFSQSCLRLSHPAAAAHFAARHGKNPRSLYRRQGGNTDLPQPHGPAAGLKGKCRKNPSRPVANGWRRRIAGVKLSGMPKCLGDIFSRRFSQHQRPVFQPDGMDAPVWRGSKTRRHEYWQSIIPAIFFIRILHPFAAFWARPPNISYSAVAHHGHFSRRFNGFKCRQHHAQ